MSSQIPCKERCFEDFSTGESFVLGSVEMVEAEMINFATQFDPQPFHTDPQAAVDTIFGGLVASGCHTLSLMMKLNTEHFLGENALGSPGIRELSWPVPARPGDVLTLEVNILDMRVSKSRPNLGLIEVNYEMTNQNADLSLKAISTIMFAKRDASR